MATQIERAVLEKHGIKRVGDEPVAAAPAAGGGVVAEGAAVAASANGSAPAHATKKAAKVPIDTPRA